ncbi:MAG: NAD-glutamate dehydrogenase, partial [Rhizomicrobium sp.]
MTIHKLECSEDEAAKTLLVQARALLKTKEEQEFLDLLFAGAASEDITRGNAAGLAGLASMAWHQAKNHEPGAIEVSLLPGSDPQDPETVVVAVNDDRPFLFDTALAAALAGGARIRAAFHPIVMLAGKPTSVIVLAADAIPGEESARQLKGSLESSFAQGRDAVRDWKPMLKRLQEARAELAARPPKGGAIHEDLAFLDWLGDNYFTFLGARDYALQKDGEYGRLDPVPASGLGALSDDDARVIRQTAERPALTREVRAFLDRPEALVVTKSNARSLVHRRGHMDYVGVKTFDADGRFAGERRFVGLFTSSAYALSPRETPVLRKKCAAAMARAGSAPASHDGKALAHILETFPRDELFQISEDELFETAIGILRLGGRPKIKLFLRFDRFDRFVSVLLFAPRDHVNAELQAKLHALLARAFNGRASAAIPAIDDESALVRVHYIIGRNPGPRPKVDVRRLEQEVADAIKSWDDAFLEAISARHGRAEGLRRIRARAARFTAGYRGVFSPATAAQDLEMLEMLAARQTGLKVHAHAYREAQDTHSALRLKLFVLGEVLPLSVSLPIFENLGLKVIAEDAYPVRFKRDDGWTEEGAVLNFQMERADGGPAMLKEIGAPLEDVFHAVLGGLAESDGFNRLVIGAGLSWRDVAILRMVAKFLRQAAFAFSQDYIEQALARNPEIAAGLAGLFHARLDP